MLLIREKYYIYIYDEKLWFIDILIGAQYQQVNMTPDSVWSCMRLFQDCTSNLLSWKKILSISPSSPRDASITSSGGSR